MLNSTDGSWRGGVHLHDGKSCSKVEGVDYDTIAEILKYKNEIVIGSWGNGIYLVKE